MKTKKKHLRVKIIVEDENGEIQEKHEEIAVSEYKSYDDAEDRIIGIEQKVGRFLRAETVKKKKQNKWKRLWKQIAKFFAMGKKDSK